MSRTGRPREFDREAALESAMLLFWAHGYEGTTLADLQKAMGGITAPSFYAAFGSKEDLFRETVELYKTLRGEPPLKALTNGTTARDSIEGMLRAAAASICEKNHPRGCMLVVGAINCAAPNKGIEDFLREQRAAREKVIAQRLRRGVTEGDLPPDTDIHALVSFYSSIIDGMAIQAKDGASPKVLNNVVKCAMAAWDTIVQSDGRT